MLWAQQGPGLTLLLVTAQHSCGRQASSSPGERPSPHPSPAPASSPGGDKAQNPRAQKPGAQKPGAQNPAPAYAGKGLLQEQGIVLAQGWGFRGRICVMALPDELWAPWGWGKCVGKGQAGALGSLCPISPRELRLGGIKLMLCGLEFSLLSTSAFSPSILFSFNPLGSAGVVNISCFSESSDTSSDTSEDSEDNPSCPQVPQVKPSPAHLELCPARDPPEHHQEGQIHQTTPKFHK